MEDVCVQRGKSWRTTCAKEYVPSLNSGWMGNVSVWMMKFAMLREYATHLAVPTNNELRESVFASMATTEESPPHAFRSVAQSAFSGMIGSGNAGRYVRVRAR